MNLIANEPFPVPDISAALAPTLHLTVVAVELREPEIGQGHWLAVDFAEQIKGDCELITRTIGGQSGWEPTTRKTLYRKDDPGFLPIEHNRIEWLLPPELDAARASCPGSRAAVS